MIRALIRSRCNVTDKVQVAVVGSAAPAPELAYLFQHLAASVLRAQLRYVLLIAYGAVFACLHRVAHFAEQHRVHLAQQVLLHVVAALEIIVRGLYLRWQHIHDAVYQVSEVDVGVGGGGVDAGIEIHKVQRAEDVIDGITPLHRQLIDSILRLLVLNKAFPIDGACAGIFQYYRAFQCLLGQQRVPVKGQPVMRLTRVNDADVARLGSHRSEDVRVVILFGDDRCRSTVKDAGTADCTVYLYPQRFFLAESHEVYCVLYVSHISVKVKSEV